MRYTPRSIPLKEPIRISVPECLRSTDHLQDKPNVSAVAVPTGLDKGVPGLARLGVDPGSFQPCGVCRRGDLAMRTTRRLRALGIVAAVGALALTGGPAMASAAPSPQSARAYTCTGGDLSTGDFVHVPSGTYASLTIAGACDVVPGATINIVGNLNVLSGAVFDAQSAPSTITVGHNVTAGRGRPPGAGLPAQRPLQGWTSVRRAHATAHSTITVRETSRPPAQTPFC